MHRLARLLRPVVAAARTQEVVVEVPDHRRPGVVEHPLDHAGGGVLVASVPLEHRALAFVGEGLGLARVVLGAGGLPVAPLERVGEQPQVLELVAAGVVAPEVVDRPEVVGGKHALQALDGRHRCPRADLGGEAEGAAVLGVGEPVRRRHVVVGATHLDAARPADGPGRLGAARHHGPVPLRLLQHVEVFPLHGRRGGRVASVEPGEDARVVAHAEDLVAERQRRDPVVLGVPLVPFLPLVAAAPAGHQQDSVTVGRLVERLALQLAFQADRVEPHLLDVAHLRFESLGRDGA